MTSCCFRDYRTAALLAWPGRSSSCHVIQLTLASDATSGAHLRLTVPAGPVAADGGWRPARHVPTDYLLVPDSACLTLTAVLY